MKSILIHHRMTGYTSHHFNEAAGMLEELGRRGSELLVLVHERAEPRVLSELRAKAVLEDPTFRLEWSFEERSRRFVDMLHRQVDPLLGAGDRVLLTISTQLEAHALATWLQELRPRKKPWIVVVFLSDRWNRAGHEEYDRQIAEFRKLAALLSALSAEDRRRLIFLTVAELLLPELSDLLGTGVTYAPIPLPYVDPPETSSIRAPSARPRVAILGGTRREKGSYLIPDIIHACRPRVAVEFIVHLTNNTLTAEEVARLSQVALMPEVTVLPEALPMGEYHSALHGSDLALFPYEVVPYRKRTSGVFAETVAYGKPAVVSPGTWLAAQIEAGRAIGIIADNLLPESYARAVADCVANLPSLQRSARELSTEWRKNMGIAAFLDVLEGEIARRSSEEAPRRRWYWPF